MVAVPRWLFMGPAGRCWGFKHGVTHNIPFPTQNSSHGSDRMLGLVLHTEVAPSEAGVIKEFNNLSAAASAFFSVADTGRVHQYIPIGKGMYSWAQAAGNREWYSVECEDKGFPNTPLSTFQIESLAQLLEFLSWFAGFPMTVTNDVGTPGFGVHFMGGKAWGNHTCPDLPPAHVRSSQRQEIIDLARKIREARNADQG